MVQSMIVEHYHVDLNVVNNIHAVVIPLCIVDLSTLNKTNDRIISNERGKTKIIINLKTYNRRHCLPLNFLRTPVSD